MTLVWQWFLGYNIKSTGSRTSPVLQSLRIRLPMQGTWVGMWNDATAVEISLEVPQIIKQRITIFHFWVSIQKNWRQGLTYLHGNIHSSIIHSSPPMSNSKIYKLNFFEFLFLLFPYIIFFLILEYNWLTILC